MEQLKQGQVLVGGGKNEFLGECGVKIDSQSDGLMIHAPFFPNSVLFGVVLNRVPGKSLKF
jgi:hypothetical protein